MNTDFSKIFQIIIDSIQSINLSSVFAWAGALVALSSARSAKKQYQLMKLQDERRNPNLNIKIEQALNVYNSDTNALDYIFDIMVKNNTDIDNSVTRIQLLIRYEFNGSNLFHVADYSGTFKVNDKKVTSNLPISIGANQSEKISCHFAFPEDWILDRSVIDYTIRVYDTHDNTYLDTNIFVIGEMRHEDIQ